MERANRLFNCLRCHAQVIICSDCDRGNVYCSSNCSELVRRESMCEAGKRYQQSQRGKQHHAARQKRYREREIKKVTHQGSHSTAVSPDCLCPQSDPDVINNACHFCGQHTTPYLRPCFLRHYSGVAGNGVATPALGP